MAPKNDKVEQFTKGDRVRVWWPPTSDKAKTDYAGAPLLSLSVSADTCCSLGTPAEQQWRRVVVSYPDVERSKQHAQITCRYVLAGYNNIMREQREVQSRVRQWGDRIG